MLCLDALMLYLLIWQEVLLPQAQTDRATRSKSCQLLHNSVETSCTMNQQQMEIMELQGYSRSTCNNFVHPATVPRCARPSSVWSESSTVDEFWRPHHRLAVAKFKSRVWGSLTGKYPYFWRYPNFLKIQLRIGRRKLPCQKPALTV